MPGRAPFPAGRLMCVLALALLALWPVACGKRGRPLPPLERVPQRTELLSGAQQGNQVLLSWPAPLRNAPQGSVQNIDHVDIYRLAEKTDAPLPLTEEEFAARATVVGTLSAEEIKNAKGTLEYVDTLQLAGRPTRLRYAVRYVNSAGQKAAFSNFILLEPAPRVANPPRITALSESETAITIRWAAPDANIDGSAGLNIAGYNIYRSETAAGERGAEPLNGAQPVSGNEFADKTFRFGAQYVYVIRAVSLGLNGQPVESLNSNTVTAAPRDHYPPTAPGSLSLAVSPNGQAIALFFPANPERDVTGYYVFRTEDPNLPARQWQNLTPDLLTRTTYRDEKVMAGHTYYYYLVAVDADGNVSAPSETVRETVPDK